MRETKMPPHSLSAEKGLIGVAVLWPEQTDVAISILKPHHFYSEHYRVIFEILIEERKMGRDPNPNAVAVEMVKRGLESSEGDALMFVTDSMEGSHRQSLVSSDALIILDKYQRRAAQYAVEEARKELEDPSSETLDVISVVAEKMHVVISDGILDMPRRASDVISVDFDKPTIAMRPTGFADLDSFSGGVGPKTMTVLAARPSVGKTSLAVAICNRMLKRGSRALFFSLEMTTDEIVNRIASIELGLPFSWVRDGRLNTQEREYLTGMKQSEWLANFFIDERNRTVEEMSAIARLHSRRFGVDLVVIDYLQLIPPSNPRQPREQQVAESSRSIKRMAKEANVAVICLAQLNREVEKRDEKRPRSTDLRESGSIEQDADQLWLLWRPEKDGTGTDDHAEIIVAKTKNDRTGSTKLSWHGPTMTYGDYAGRTEIDRFD